MEKTKFIIKVLALMAIVPLLVFAEIRHTAVKKNGPHGISYEGTADCPPPDTNSGEITATAFPGPTPANF